MEVNKKTSMKGVAEIINAMLGDVANIKTQTTKMDETIQTNTKDIKTINNKFQGNQAKDALKFDGSDKSDFIMKKDMIALNTQSITTDEAELTITYNMTDGINKEVSVGKDIVIHFNIDEEQKTIAIPSSIILLNIANKAEVTFKNISFVNGLAMPTIEDNEYKMLVEIAYVGTNWYIKNISVITDSIEG